MLVCRTGRLCVSYPLFLSFSLFLSFFLFFALPLLFSLALLLWPAQAHAHGDKSAEQAYWTTTALPGTLEVSAGIATSYRNDGVSYSREDNSQDGLWQIPGILMGGDAHAPEKGFALDQASLHLDWYNDDGLLAGLEYGQHGDHDPGFEQAYAGLTLALTEQANLGIKAGRLKGAFSPENTTHAYSRPFSENNLLYDAFYGGHYSDDGLQLTLQYETLTLGMEAWQGEHFPATPGNGGEAQDIYLYWQPQHGDWSWRIGGWLFHARAEQRSDDRLDSGHLHGGAVSSDNPVQFDGTQLSGGLLASVRHQSHSPLWWQVSGEWQTVDVEGNLEDATRSAELQGDYSGFRIQPELGYGPHALALRYIRLRTDNHLTGAGGPGLAEEAGLLVSDDPDWLGLSYSYQWRHGLNLRLEWTRNGSTDQETDYFTVGLVWRGLLLSGKDA